MNPVHLSPRLHYLMKGKFKSDTRETKHPLNWNIDFMHRVLPYLSDATMLTGYWMWWSGCTLLTRVACLWVRHRRKWPSTIGRILRDVTLTFHTCSAKKWQIGYNWAVVNRMSVRPYIHSWPKQKINLSWLSQLISYVNNPEDFQTDTKTVATTSG